MSTDLTTRIDKNLAYNIRSFNKDISKGNYDMYTSDLIKSFLIYVSFSYHTDLFGFGLFDPYLFGNTMGYRRQDLFSKSTNPYQFSNLTNVEIEILEENERINGTFSEDRIFDSNIENVLHILNNKPLPFKLKSKDESGEYVSFENVIVIKQLKLYVKKTGPNQKVYYKYILDDRFINNLKKFFLSVNINTYKKLNKSRTHNLYLTILDLVNNLSKKGGNTFTFNFDHLIESFNIKINEESFEKDQYYMRKVKYKINKKLEKLYEELIRTIPGFKFSWVKRPNHRYYYVLSMYWDAVKGEIDKMKSEKSLQEVFDNTVKTELLKLYRKKISKNGNTHTDDEKQSFFGWLISDKNYEDKKSLFVYFYNDHFGHQISRHDAFSPENKAKQYFERLLNLHLDEKLNEMVF